MQIRDEHDAFQSIIQGLKIAAEGCRQMSRYQPDLRDPWLKMAEVFTVSEHSVFQLAQERASRIIKS